MTVNGINIKINILILVAIFATASLAHEHMNCWVCGKNIEGNEGPRTGICNSTSDQGFNTTCVDDTQSCQTTMLNRNGTQLWMKTCGHTGDYHVVGCLTIDDPDEKADGKTCFCADHNCNNNFDAFNGASRHGIVAPVSVLMTVL